MEYLELPFDLIWEGKIEPLSPNQLALVNSEDILIFENDFSTDLILNDSDVSFDGKKSAEEILFELQQDISEEEEENEESNHWIDETITLPILTEYIHPPQQRQPLKVEQTAQLLREFDSVLDAVELTHLTPPQTPPESPPESPQVDSLNDLKLDHFIFPGTPQSQPPLILNANFFNFDANESIPSPVCSQDIAHEMEVVEELVRSRAENLPDCTSDDDDNSSESYSASSTPRSDDSFDNASPSYSNDDEWSPKSSPSLVSSSAVKKRTRPYGRSSDDKKFRKKEQNKNAATRYRQKKKAETEVVLEEERELQEKNDKLQVKCTDIQREIKYLKSLMRDLYRAKGLL